MQGFSTTGYSCIQTTYKGSDIITLASEGDRACIGERDVIRYRHVFIEHNTVVLVLRRQRRQRHITIKDH